MRAVAAVSSACTLVERAIPSLAPNQLLLRVAYSAVNRADTLQRRGLYNPPANSTDILGLEAVGVVHALGSGLQGPAVGTRLMALLPGGGNAEYVAVLPSHCLPLPPAFPMRTAAAIPETWLTAFQLLFLEGSATHLAASAPLQGSLAGLVVVVHAAGSGVGTAAVQLAAAAGARVVAVAGSAAKLAVCASLGAAQGLDYKAPDFAAQLKAAVGPQGAALILDPVGASLSAANAEALAQDGTWVLYGSMGGLRLSGEGSAADTLLGALLRKRGRLLGTTLRNRSDEYKSLLVERFAHAAWPGLASGALKPVIHAQFSLQDTQAAHEMMEGNANTGKILLKVAEDADAL